jgi:hypothetical protein
MSRKGPELLTIYDCSGCKYLHSNIEDGKNVTKCRKLLGRVIKGSMDYRVLCGDREILKTPIDCPLLGKTEEDVSINTNIPIG